MSRLIDADKLKRHYAWWKGGTREMTMDEAKSDFDCIIDLQPTIEAEPRKHGRWIKWEGDVLTCSNCKHYWIQSGDQYDFNYCPYCGARMDEVEE